MGVLIKSMRINLQISVFDNIGMLETLIFTPVEYLNAAR